MCLISRANTVFVNQIILLLSPCLFALNTFLVVFLWVYFIKNYWFFVILVF
ncbi:hypothetical protein [uncultured Gammaproteobacteria bacterium]|nr:hypothetical protein [uncultured Gammaproteobacteria bacterium]CAC9636605.1 hypothetical protein [uncultured Gammaproteobacteria bacterium]CAC9645058.1 hypothetical protein [uncultured Gammaproteobacteria bacterium]CAC9649346.1 hypothetical protein [uncultured Gammaproteobacteria bacterium]VVH51931.1 hypothetical protein BPUTSESOX_722 [uncultured Gammaproteobacteria bacterium]